MMTRQLMCVCLLLCISTGCGKRPPLALPTSDWTTSEPISGYQWYTDGKPDGERKAIEKTSRLLLVAATIDEGRFITWTLQVAPGESNIIGSGRIRVDPKNLPKLSWPPSGSLRIDKRQCIFRIEQGGSRSEIRELFVDSMPSAKTEQAGAADSSSAATKTFAFEGTYIDTNYNDRPTVTFRAGRYEGALPANPGGSINGSGSYTVREVGHESWELALKYDGGGNTTVVVRKEGDSILIRDVSYGGETRLTKK